ncbi:N-alpha-acetyltransferase 40 isoform X2 [Canis lupus dingo]|nr:N-alpha-acetyltransferase 40 isoform X2 [Canis lupus dingo]|eukprot:XP_022261464.1 N-alpha-acetyltransferase 40 isoform X1 [Canis lupus familiaris]
MDAVCAKVDAANRLGDPLEAFPVFKKYDRNGLNVSIECKRVSGLEPATVAWAFDLTKTNMQTMYEQSEWGWKDREKREEMTDDRAWYLIAWESSSVPVAFSHFRFDVECGDEVLYCYEVQLESKVRRKGLGKFLIQILQLMANSTQMKKVMLTVFKHNHGAYQFFREALQFEIDDSSPSMSGCCGEDCSYEILSRRTKFGDSQHSHAGLEKHLCEPSYCTCVHTWSHVPWRLAVQKWTSCAPGRADAPLGPCPQPALVTPCSAWTSTSLGFPSQPFPSGETSPSCLFLLLDFA